MEHTRRISAPLFLAVCLAILAGCNGGIVEPTQFGDHLLAGAVVVDRNVDMARAAVELWFNDSLITDATLSYSGTGLVFGDTLFGIDSVYSFRKASTLYSAGGYPLQVTANELDDTIASVVVNAGTIATIDPATQLVQGNTSVTIDWAPIQNVEQYVIAAVKASRAYTGVGFSDSPQVGTSGTFPPEAFLSSDGINPDTGLYNLYVYGITGAPDTALANRLLPAPLPAQIIDNIDRQGLVGHFGVVVVGWLDTVRVVQQP